MSDQSTVLQEDHLQECQFTLLRQKKRSQKKFSFTFIAFLTLLFYYESITSTFLAHFFIPNIVLNVNFC